MDSAIDDEPLEKEVSQLWELRVTKEGQRKYVKELDVRGVVTIWSEGQTTMDVMVKSDHQSKLDTALTKQTIPYTVVIDDIDAMLAADQSRFLSNKDTRSCKSCARMDWNSFQKLTTVNKYLEDLARDYSKICSLFTIGKSFEGRKIYMLKVSNGSCGNQGVWVDGGIHPREWISTSVVTFLIDILVRQREKLPKCMEDKDWYIVPIANPDGYEYTHQNDRMWRKNRATFANGIGVDLNRNFSYGWGTNGEEGSSSWESSMFYRGPSAFSEPETEAIKNAVKSATCQFRVFLSFHSYDEVIIFPWGFSSTPCPDYVELLEAGTVFSRGISEYSGRTYKVGTTKDLCYYASGTSIDWSYGELKIPYSYIIELRDRQYKFLMPTNQIPETCEEIKHGLVKFLEYIDERGKGMCGCVQKLEQVKFEERFKAKNI